MIEGFMLGSIFMACIAAGLFFLKYWRRTGDSLFLAFGAAFLIEGLNRISFLFLERPNEGSPWIYIVRLCTYLLILAAIISKNRAPR